MYSKTSCIIVDICTCVLANNPCFAVIGVSAEWVDAGFTSLRVTVPEGGMYRISYWAVNKSDGPELKVTTTSSSSQVINDFSPDYIYTIVVEDWTGSAERGKQLICNSMLS